MCWGLALRPLSGGGEEAGALGLGLEEFGDDQRTGLGEWGGGVDEAGVR